MTVYIIKFGVSDNETNQYFIRTETVTAFNIKDAIGILNCKYNDMIDPISIKTHVVEELEYE